MSQAIFLLSGDTDLFATGEKSHIPYLKYHNYYRQYLMTGGASARDVLTFFNDALFPGTSSSHASITNTGIPQSNWEEEFERAMEEGGEGPEFEVSIALHHPSVAPIVAQESESISSVMQDLTLAGTTEDPLDHLAPLVSNSRAPLPTLQANVGAARQVGTAPGPVVQSTPSAVVPPALTPVDAPQAAAKPRPKPRCKVKAVTTVDETGADPSNEDSQAAVVSAGNVQRRSGRRSNK